VVLISIEQISSPVTYWQISYSVLTWSAQAWVETVRCMTYKVLNLSGARSHLSAEGRAQLFFSPIWPEPVRIFKNNTLCTHRLGLVVTTFTDAFDIVRYYVTMSLGWRFPEAQTTRDGRWELEDVDEDENEKQDFWVVERR